MARTFPNVHAILAGERCGGLDDTANVEFRPEQIRRRREERRGHSRENKTFLREDVAPFSLPFARATRVSSAKGLDSK